MFIFHWMCCRLWHSSHDLWKRVSWAAVHVCIPENISPQKTLISLCIYLYSTKWKQQSLQGALRCRAQTIIQKNTQASTWRQWEGQTPFKYIETSGRSRLGEGNQLWGRKAGQKPHSGREPELSTRWSVGLEKPAGWPFVWASAIAPSCQAVWL